MKKLEDLKRRGGKLTGYFSHPELKFMRATKEGNLTYLMVNPSKYI